MPTVLYLKGWRFFFYSDKGNEPIHIHVQKGDSECKYWLDIDLYEIRAEQAKNRPYSVNIDSKQVDPKPTDSSQSRTATVRLTINNDDQKLAPNAIGYVKFIPKICLYFSAFS